MGFGDRLKELRKRAGLTQEQLARSAGVSTSFLSKLEQKSLDPAWSVVQALALALGVDCTAFTAPADVTPDRAADSPAKGKAAPKKGRKGK